MNNPPNTDVRLLPLPPHWAAIPAFSVAVFSAACLLAVAVATSVTGCGRGETKIDIVVLSESIRDDGIESVIEDWSEAETDGDKWRLARALESVEGILAEHPDQLWFQLQARTRQTSWKSLQEQLLESVPSNMLVAQTSLLPGPLPSVVKQWEISPGGIIHTRFSSDGKELYCAGMGSDLVVIDPRSLKITRRIPISGELLATTVGVDGDYVILRQQGNSDGIVSVQSIKTGEMIAKLKDRFANDHGRYLSRPPLHTPQSGKHLVFFNGTAYVDRELSNLTNVVRFRSLAQRDNLKPLLIDFPAADRMVSVDVGGYVHVFEYRSGKELRPPHQVLAGPECAALSPSGTRVACGGPVRDRSQESADKTTRMTIVIWGIPEGKELVRFELPQVNEATPTALAFVDDNTLLGGDRNGMIYMWDIASKTLVSSAKSHHAPIATLAPAPAQGHVFSGDAAGRVKLVNLEISTPYQELPPAPIRPFRELTDFEGRWEADRSENDVRVWERESGELLHQLEIPAALMKQLGGAVSVGIDLERTTLVLGGVGTIGHWNFMTGETRVFEVDVPQLLPPRRFGNDSAFQIQISPDARYAAGSDLNHLASFNVENGERLFRIPGEYELGDPHYFLPSGRLALGFRNRAYGGIGVYDLARGEEVDQYVRAVKPRDVTCANRAGLILTVTGSTNSKDSDAIVVWKPGEEPRFYDVPDNVRVRTVVVAPDGGRAFTVGHDGVLHLWDIPRGVVLRRFDLATRIESVLFDGTTLIVNEQYNENRHVFELVK